MNLSEIFWQKVEGELGAPVPNYIKNLCKFNGLDNPISIQCITEDVIKELEIFARTKMSKIISDLDETVNLGDYFGLYGKDPQNFALSIGDKYLLLKVVEYVKSKPTEHFSIKNINVYSSASNNLSTRFDEDSEHRKLKKQIKKMCRQHFAELEASLCDLSLDMSIEERGSSSFLLRP